MLSMDERWIQNNKWKYEIVVCYNMWKMKTKVTESIITLHFVCIDDDNQYVIPLTYTYARTQPVTYRQLLSEESLLEEKQR